MPNLPDQISIVVPVNLKNHVVYFDDLDRSGFQNLGSGDNYFYYKYYVAQSINAGAGNDTVTTGLGWDKVYGGSGNDTIATNDGNDQLNGGVGDDNLFGGAGTDLLQGSAGRDYLYGGDGTDVLEGGSGDDYLSGDTFIYATSNGGVDVLEGGSGNDVLLGGARTDFLTGGTGQDSFRYTSVDDSPLVGTDHDQIRDFNHAEGDKIDLSDLGIAGGKDHFAFRSSSAAGSVWVGDVHQDGSGHATQSVYINVDGYIADMQIDVTLAAGTTHLTASDFIL